MRPRAGTLLGLTVAGMAAWAVLEALRWPWKAALFPFTIGIPLFFLAMLEAGLTFAGRGETSPERGLDLELARDVEPALAQRRTVAIFAWSLGFFLGILVVGIHGAVFFFVLAYLRLQGREGWIPSLVLGAVAWAFVYGLFDRLLHIPFPPGWLTPWG